MHLSSRLFRKFRLLVVATLMISALGAGPALARGKTIQPNGSAVCLVTPNLVKIGVGMYTVWGSGFPAGMLVNTYVLPAGVILMAQVGPDGTFGISGYAQFNSAGTEDVYVYNALDRQMSLWAHCSFSAAY